MDFVPYSWHSVPALFMEKKGLKRVLQRDSFDTGSIYIDITYSDWLDDCGSKRLYQLSAQMVLYQ